MEEKKWEAVKLCCSSHKLGTKTGGLFLVVLHFIGVLEDDQWTLGPKLVVLGCCAAPELALRWLPAPPNPDF